MWYLAKVSPEDYASDRAYSRQLSVDCFNTTYITPCYIAPDRNNTNRTRSAPAVKDLIVGDFDNTQVNRSAGTNEFFLAPRLPDQSRSVDRHSLSFQKFTASTESVQVSCSQNLTSWCDIDTSTSISKKWSYNCTAGMIGSLTTSSRINIGSWYHPDNGQNAYNDMWAYYNNGSTYQSQVEFGFVAFFQDVRVLDTRYTDDNGNHPPISSYLEGAVNGTFIATRCNASFSSGQYDWSNTTVWPMIQSKEASLLATIAVRSRLLAGYFDSQDFDKDQETSLLAGFPRKGDTTATEINQGVISAIGLVSMSLLGGTFEPAPAINLSIGNSTIVTQVQKAPLFILVMLNLWYAGFAACLGALALYVIHDESLRQDIIDVNKLLTIEGLATSAMGSHEEQLENANARVCVQRIDGKWCLRVLADVSTFGESDKLKDSDHTVE